MESTLWLVAGLAMFAVVSSLVLHWSVFKLRRLLVDVARTNLEQAKQLDRLERAVFSTVTLTPENTDGD